MARKQLTPRETALRRNYYFRGQLFPRAKETFATFHFWLPVVIGAATGIFLPSLATTDTKIVDVATIGINYAALAFGATITGSVLAISLPGEDRVRRWANSTQKTGFSAYSELVFTLTWAALAQLGVLFVAIASTIVGGDEKVLPTNAFLTHRILLGLSLAVFAYALGQLISLVTVISQMGNIIDNESRR